MVYFYRTTGDAGACRVPTTAIGTETYNVWVSFAGRAFLCAWEHGRLATPDQMRAGVAEAAAQRDLETLRGSFRRLGATYENNCSV